MPNFTVIVSALLDFIGKEVVILETLLCEVRQTHNSIRLFCADSKVIQTDAVVLAIPLQSMQNLIFSPSIPKGLVTPKVDPQVVTSFTCKFNVDFWKSDQPTTSFMFHGPHMVAYPYDNDGCLGGLVFPDRSADGLSVKQHVLDKLIPNNGSDDVQCVLWNERSWEQSTIIGLPMTKVWRRIAWAGTNNGELYRGYSNGAVQGGIRAALLVLVMMRPAVVCWEDLAKVQRANVVHPRSMGNFQRWLLRLNLCNSLRYFVVIPATGWAVYYSYNRWCV